AACVGGNGAGLRHDHGTLSVRRCIFQNNQNGILIAENPAISARVIDCSFVQNGAGCGHTHSIYACSGVASLVVGLCSFRDTVVGHHLKSRAAQTRVTHSYFCDTPAATTSYAIDIANGGDAFIAENLFVQGCTSLSPKIISYASEGLAFSSNYCQVVHNIFVSHRRSV